jgi:hypothetical protein
MGKPGEQSGRQELLHGVGIAVRPGGFEDGSQLGKDLGCSPARRAAGCGPLLDVLAVEEAGQAHDAHGGGRLQPGQDGGGLAGVFGAALALVAQDGDLAASQR